MESDQKIAFWLRYLTICRILFGMFSLYFLYYSIQCIRIGKEATGDPGSVALFQDATTFFALLWLLPAAGFAILSIGAKHFIAAAAPDDER